VLALSVVDGARATTCTIVGSADGSTTAGAPADSGVVVASAGNFTVGI
jgi:hypothetical protein